MLTPTAKPTTDRDARRFAIYATDCILAAGDIVEPDTTRRLAIASMIECGLYKLALADNFTFQRLERESTQSDMRPLRLLADGLLKPGRTPREVEMLYDRWWGRFYDQGCDAQRGGGDGVVGRAAQECDARSKKQGADMLPPIKKRKNVPGIGRVGVCKKP